MGYRSSPTPRRSLARGWRGPKARRAGTAGSQRAYSGTYGCGEGGSTCMFFPEETKLKLFSGGKRGSAGFPLVLMEWSGACWCEGQDGTEGFPGCSTPNRCVGYMAWDAPGHGTGLSPPCVTVPRDTPAPMQLRGGGLAASRTPVEDAEHFPHTLHRGLATHEQPLLLFFPRSCVQADRGFFWGAYVHCCVWGGGCHIPGPLPCLGPPLGSCPSVTSVCPALPLAAQHLPGGHSLRR